MAYIDGLSYNEYITFRGKYRFHVRRDYEIVQFTPEEEKKIVSAIDLIESPCLLSDRELMVKIMMKIDAPVGGTLKLKFFNLSQNSFSFQVL